MYGYADFKSHVLRRDEKGLLGIPFKRLLGCGLGAGGLMTGIKPIFPEWSVLIGAVSLLLLLIFTQPRQGIPRWRQVWYSTRWRIVSTAALAPEGVVGQFASLLHLPIDALTIDAATLFTHLEEAAPRTKLTDWVSFTRPIDAGHGKGLALSATPGLSLHGGAS